MDVGTSCNRLFYTLPEIQTFASHSDNGNKSSDILKFISNNIIGRGKIFSGPFGLRKELYLDYTASGKSLKFIEDYITNEVLTEYGNTHTTTSVSSLQTTLYRHEARDIIRNAVNASEHDAVIFVGSGTTGAVHKLVHSLNLEHTPVVFVGPYEHHSNLLPWIEMGAKVIGVRSDKQGLVDIHHLENLLQKWKATGRQLIGCFSAASNVTGILIDVDTINVCLHKHGALAFWDYATAAPYVKVDMNPVSTSADQPYMYKDAVFMSPHKFVGGVQTPGVLVAKKSLFRNRVPDGCGGGSVFFVRREGHRYLQEPELKEEGGTPAIVEAIRAGLVFQLKQAVTTDVIMQREQYMLQRAEEAWKDIPSLVLLGNMELERLPIFSFLIYHRQSGSFLHHNYVSTLLNDLFGIQARGGCACAGPYAMDLLGMEEDISRQIEELLAEDSRLDRTHLRRYREYSQREIIRPGFTRLNLPYFMDDETLGFVLEAVKLVAEEGWKLLPQYMFNPETGEWRQVNFQVFKDRKWLGHISYKSGEMKYKVPPPVVKGPVPEDYQDCLQKAKDLFAQATKTRYQLADHTLMFDEAMKPFRWFLLPSEAAKCLAGNQTTEIAAALPFCPPQLRESLGLPVPIGQTTQNAAALPFCPPQLRESLGLPVFIGSHDNGDCDVTDYVLKSGTDSQYQCEANGKVVGNSNELDIVTEKCGETNIRNEIKESKEQLKLNEDLLLKSSELNAETIVPVKPSSFSSHLKEMIVQDKSAGGFVTEYPFGYGMKGRRKRKNEKNCEETTQPIFDGSQTGDDNVLKIVRDESVVSCDAVLGRDNSAGGETRQERIRIRNLERKLRKKNRQNFPNTSHLQPICDLNLNGGDNVDISWKTGISSVSVTCATNALEDSENIASCTVNNDGLTNANDMTENSDSTCDKTIEDRNSDHDETEPVKTGEKLEENDGNYPNVDTGMKTESSDKTVGQESRKRKIVSDKIPSDDEAKKSKEKMDNNANGKKEKRKKSTWFSPPKTIFAPFLKAVEEYGMFSDGDKVLVCLSGGKDSLSLLHTVRQYQFYARKKDIHFELGAVTVDPETPSYDPSPLKQYLASLSVPYFYESQGILEQASNLPYECASICSFCSRMKRGRIYACARREGYNVLALGQHLDDLCESFLMSTFHNGLLRTMKACYTVEEGDLRVIRPFVYVREKDLRTFAEKNKLPVIAENCPACFEAPKERHRTKQLLASQEIMFPRIFNSLMSAIKPIMAINKTGVKITDFLQQETSQDDIDI